MNPLISDALVDFLLDDVLHVEQLLTLPKFQQHDLQATLKPFVNACRALARQQLYPAYRAMDVEPPRLVDGHVIAHPKMRGLWQALAELGVITGPRELPLTVFSLASCYLMAANLSAYGYAGLTAGAAHLIETFGDDAVKALFLDQMLDGRFSGTMALTEPQAGSSLADLTTRATPDGDTFRIKGSKIFISGGDQDFTDNIVHLVLARIDGAPAGTRGISLFAVPRTRPDGTPNDVSVAGVIHKIGWRGMPSLALNFGESGDCIGWLVGTPHQGLKHMFQMMNEARLMVGANGVSTASVAFHESKAYALDRRQGRAAGSNASTGPVAIVEHADVRRMLLRQKAIVEGAMCLLGVTARYADLATHGPAETRAHHQALLDLLTPIAKTFPAEAGYESNTLALQIHGGYGYSSEYLPEAWLRDQKLNSLHEGTTGIQSLDLLGRKVLGTQGQSLMLLAAEIEADLASAALPELAEAVKQTVAVVASSISPTDLETNLAHANDFLQLMSGLVIGWMWLKMTNAAAGKDEAFARGLRQAGLYWARTELPKAPAIAQAMTDRSFVEIKPDEL